MNDTRSTLRYPGFRFPAEIIGHAVWLYHRFTLSFRDIEDLLAERGILAQLHQLNAIFAIFGASDRDKSLDLKGRGLRKRLWCRPSALRGRGRSANLRHVFALQDSPQGRQGPSGMVGCRKSARS
jgi:hypothetical protein